MKIKKKIVKKNEKKNVKGMRTKLEIKNIEE
jgi:hypothetical protein